MSPSSAPRTTHLGYYLRRISGICLESQVADCYVLGAYKTECGIDRSRIRRWSVENVATNPVTFNDCAAWGRNWLLDNVGLTSTAGEQHLGSAVFCRKSKRRLDSRGAIGLSIGYSTIGNHTDLRLNWQDC